MLTTFNLDSMPKVHIVDRYLETIKHLGIKNDNDGLDFFLSATDKVEISIFPKDYIVLLLEGNMQLKFCQMRRLFLSLKK